MVIVCPIEGCNKTFNSLSALKVHFKRVHLSIRVCPVCGWSKGKNVVIHATTKSDEAHQALVYLMIRSKGGETYRKRREIAEKLLTVEKCDDCSNMTFQKLIEQNLNRK